MEERKLVCGQPSSGKVRQRKVGKRAVWTRWTHEGFGVLRHILESLATELLGRIEVRANEEPQANSCRHSARREMRKRFARKPK